MKINPLLLLALAGIAVGDFLNLTYYFTAVQPAGGYLIRAFWRAAPFHLLSLVSRAAIATVAALPFGFERPLVFFVVPALGLILVFGEIGVDEALKRGGSEDKFDGWFFRYAVKSLVRLNLFINFRYGYVVQVLRERDNFDCQQGEGYWRTTLEGPQLGRRLRLLYELHKDDIARRKRNPALRKHRYGVNPFQNFYLLLEVLGRRRLHELLLRSEIKAPLPGRNWDGSERRRVNGEYSDRRAPDPNQRYKRGYDDQQDY